MLLFRPPDLSIQSYNPIFDKYMFKVVSDYINFYQQNLQRILFKKQNFLIPIDSKNYTIVFNCNYTKL